MISSKSWYIYLIRIMPAADGWLKNLILYKKLSKKKMLKKHPEKVPN